MLALITGGSGSGKSEYAEGLVCSLGGRRVYLATMRVSDDESRERVQRHRKLRADKQFITIEQTSNIGKIPLLPDSDVLLEDMGNLLANIMYGPKIKRDVREIADAVLKEITDLSRICSNLVIVTNDVFSDGVEYEEETVRYMKLLAYINKETANAADFVAEVICGIPNILKEPI